MSESNARGVESGYDNVPEDDDQGYPDPSLLNEYDAFVSRNYPDREAENPLPKEHDAMVEGGGPEIDDSTHGSELVSEADSALVPEAEAQQRGEDGVGSAVEAEAPEKEGGQPESAEDNIMDFEEFISERQKKAQSHGPQSLQEEIEGPSNSLDELVVDAPQSDSDAEPSRDEALPEGPLLTREEIEQLSTKEGVFRSFPGKVLSGPQKDSRFYIGLRDIDEYMSSRPESNGARTDRFLDALSDKAEMVNGIRAVPVSDISGVVAGAHTMTPKMEKKLAPDASSPIQYSNPDDIRQHQERSAGTEDSAKRLNEDFAPRSSATPDTATSAGHGSDLTEKGAGSKGQQQQSEKKRREDIERERQQQQQGKSSRGGGFSSLMHNMAANTATSGLIGVRGAMEAGKNVRGGVKSKNATAGPDARREAARSRVDSLYGQLNSNLALMEAHDQEGGVDNKKRMQIQRNMARMEKDVSENSHIYNDTNNYQSRDHAKNMQSVMGRNKSLSEKLGNSGGIDKDKSSSFSEKIGEALKNLRKAMENIVKKLTGRNSPSPSM